MRHHSVQFPATGMKARIVNHLTINGTYLKPKRKYNIVPTLGVQQSSIYRTDVVLNYDYSSRKGFVTKRDPHEAKNCIKRLNKLISQINHIYDSAVSDFCNNGGKLMDIDFWNRYLGIEEKRKPSVSAKAHK